MKAVLALGALEPPAGRVFVWTRRIGGARFFAKGQFYRFRVEMKNKPREELFRDFVAFGFRELTLYLPGDRLPNDWPSDDDPRVIPFALRGEGVWRGETIALHAGEDDLALWLGTIEPVRAGGPLPEQLTPRVAPLWLWALTGTLAVTTAGLGIYAVAAHRKQSRRKELSS
jgi:hypothetical protein